MNEDEKNQLVKTLIAALCVFGIVLILLQIENIAYKYAPIPTTSYPIDIGTMVYVPGMNITGKVDRIWTHPVVEGDGGGFSADVIFFSRNGVISKANVNVENLELVDKEDLMYPLGY